jgi:hypothetical protein
MEYRDAIKLVGVADGTFDYWTRRSNARPAARFRAAACFRRRDIFILSLVRKQLAPLSDRS